MQAGLPKSISSVWRGLFDVIEDKHIDRTCCKFDLAPNAYRPKCALFSRLEFAIPLTNNDLHDFLIVASRLGTHGLPPTFVTGCGVPHPCILNELRGIQSDMV